MSPKYMAFALTTVVVVASDQLSKNWIRTNLELWEGRKDVIPGFFQLVHYENTGAAFGMADGMMVLFALFTVVALALMVWMTWKLEPGQTFVAGLMGLITGGAIGNAIDRVLFQAVTDFLRFYTDNPAASTWLRDTFGSAEWPSFNIADSAIVVGIIAFFIQQLLQDRFAKEEELAEEDLPELAESP